MSKKTNDSMINMARVGNYTKGAIKQFEENIVNKHNYLEEVNETLNKNDNSLK